MNTRTPMRWLSLLAAALLVACSESAPTEPLSAPDDEAFAVVMPDLEPEAGTAGTDRYVPVLQRILVRSIGQIRAKRGDDAAAQVVSQAQELREAVRAAKEAGDAALVKENLNKLDRFAAQVGLRVFGPKLIRHVAQDAAGKLDAVKAGLAAAAEAGQDVTRLTKAARSAAQQLKMAREAAANDKPVAALVFAAHALDVLTKVQASLQ